MNRFCLTSIVMLCLSSPVFAQAPPAPPDEEAQDTRTSTTFPHVTFGVLSFIQYSAELHERDGYNAFDVTRGYFNVEAQLTDRVKVRFTPDVRPTTDASLNRNLTLRMEYASLDAKMSDNVQVMFGLHQTPWLSYEESLTRYRVLGPLFSERMGLIPGPTDLGVSVKATRGRTEMHGGVYNGEGYGQAEFDKYKSLDGRVTFHPFAEDGELANVSVSGFYQYGWYARDRPRNVAIVMGAYENTHVVATAQYLSATDNPFVAVDIQRKGLSFFSEVRQGITGWAGILGVDLIDPNGEDDNDSQRRYVFGGARWSQIGRGRFGLVVSLEQINGGYGGGGASQLLQRRLLAQTHIQF
jgi:hypothetical protein